MDLFRLKLLPRSPWRTPWQADTLTGLLCAICARLRGADVLREELINPMLEGKPPFVLSDACPGDLLPVPISVRLWDAWPHEKIKTVERARWIAPATFDRLRQSEPPPLDEPLPKLVSDEDLLLTDVRHHNTLSRLTDTTGEAESGLTIFSKPDIHLRTRNTKEAPNSYLNGKDYLSVYFRVATPSAKDLLLHLFNALAETGFGADIATGRGQFEIIASTERMPNPEPMPNLDATPSNASAVICLSTFQPGPKDPTDGLWDAFSKSGKLGPDLGLENAHTHKRTLILFRPGACFRTESHPPYLGRAIPMDQLLLSEVSTGLCARGINIIHPAFGLAIPAKLSWEKNNPNEKE